MIKLRIFKIVSLADFLSILNALFGFSAIIYTSLYSFDYRAFQLLVCACLIDGIDGILARKTGKSPIGKELDSLSDATSFGILPAVALVDYEKNLFPVAALLLAFSILRLARFNVENFKDFYGLPTVSNALFVCGLILMRTDLHLVAAVVVLTSVLMISDLVYPKLERSKALVAGAIILLAALFEHFLLFLIILLLGYILYPMINSLYGHIKSSL